jgi:hypothetical protein
LTQEISELAALPIISEWLVTAFDFSIWNPGIQKIEL